MTARMGASLWLVLVLGLSAGCVPVTPVVPPITAPVALTDVRGLERGTPRETVLATLGEQNRVLATDRTEIYVVQSIEGYQVWVIVLAALPMLATTGYAWHVLADYDAQGSLQRLAWERSGSAVGGAKGPSDFMPLDRGGDVAPGPASAERLVGWQGRRVVLSPDGRRALVVQLSGDDTIIAVHRPIAAQLWDLEAREALGPQVRPPHRLDGPLALFDDGHVAGACVGGQVCLWDARTGEVRWSVAAEGAGGFFGPSGFPVGLAAAPGDAGLAVTDDQPLLRLVDRRAGGTILSRRLTGLSLPAWAGDRAIVAEALPSGGVRFTDVADDRTLLETAHHLRGSLTGISEARGLTRASMMRSAAATAMPAEGLFAVAADGLRLALNRQTHVEVYSRADPTAAFRLWRVYLLPVFVDIEDLFPLGTIGFSADGRRLAAGYGTLTVWDLDDDREILRLVPSRPAGLPVPAGEIDLVHGFRFLPDGRHFVTANGLYAIVEFAHPALAQGLDQP
jgi:hypothetical protein